MLGEEAYGIPLETSGVLRKYRHLRYDQQPSIPNKSVVLAT